LSSVPTGTEEPAFKRLRRLDKNPQSIGLIKFQDHPFYLKFGKKKPNIGKTVPGFLIPGVEFVRKFGDQPFKPLHFPGAGQRELLF
jgi:hypothetical protein